MFTSDRTYNSILLIKPGAIGDLLQMSPVIRALHRTWPSARITMLVGSEATAALFRHDPRISAVLVLERTWRSLSSLLRTVRAGTYDLVLNFQRSNLRTWAVIAAAFPCRILVYHKEWTRSLHAVRNYLETLAPLGIPADDLRLEMFLDASERRAAREILARLGLDGAPIVALNPGATHAVNRWPAVRFAELCDSIAAGGTGRVLLVGGPDDLPLSREIIDRSASKPASVTGTTSLQQLGALLERCAVLVSGDTGPMHLATAVGTKVIALFGAADPLRTGPVGPRHRVIQASGVPCVPCRSRTCANRNYLECMERIPAGEVMRAVEDALSDRLPSGTV